MTLRRIPLKLLRTTGATNGDVPTYDSATDRLVYARPTGGGSGAVPKGTTLPDPATLPNSMFVLLPPASAYASQVLAKNPLAYYHLAEASGTALVDSSGNGRHGVYEGTPTFGAASLVSGSDAAVTFSGDDRGKITGAGWLPTTAFTLEAWFKPAAGAIGKFNQIVNNSGGAFVRLLNSGKIDFVVGGTQVVAPSAVAAGSIYHVAGAYDGATMSLYVNGAPVASTAKTGSVTAGTLWLGDTGSGSDYAIGVLDEAAVYGTAHAAGEIQDRYNVGIGAGSGLAPVGAQLYYSDGNSWQLLGAKNIDSLVDVDTSTVAPADKALLRWDATAKQWKPAAGGLVPTGGTGGQTLVKGSSADFDVSWATPSGGGGGSGSAWSALVAANPMTSLSGWAVKAGTWTLGTYGVQQTDTAAQNAYLEYLSNVPLSSVAMKATIRFPGATPTWAAGFQLFADDAVVGNPALSVWLRRDAFIQWDRFGSGGGTFNTGVGLASDTDIAFAVIKRATMVDCFINGAHIVTITTDTATSWSRRRVGLECRAGNAWFRDVSIWVPATPW